MATETNTLRIVLDSRGALKNAEDLDRKLTQVEKTGIKASSSADALSTSLKSLAGYMGGILAISSAISMADGYTQMAARIRNATSSAQEYAMVQDRILETANGTYRSLSEAQEVYLSLAGGMKSLGKTTADTLDVADSLSYAFVANAARADQAQSAMDALSKSMAKGKIDADAWISIVSAADNVIADMAKTTGKTEAEIRKLGAEGKASLTDLLETLKATRDTNKQLADNMENSVADGFQKLTNSVTVYLGKLNETSGATGTIAAALGGLGDNIDKVAVAGGILASVMAGRVASGYAAATVAAIANTSATAASAGAMATATAAARALYIALGGPVGLAVTVAGAAASYLLLSNNVKDNTKSLRENNESVKDAISAYTQLDAVQKRAQLAKEKSDLKELSDSYENLTSRLNTNAYALSRHNDFTQAQSKEVNALIAEFKRTGDLDKFSSSINKLSYISQDSKDKFNALAGQVRASGNEYKNQKQFVDAMTNSLNQNAAAGDNAARGIRNAAEAVAEYTGKLKQQKWDLEFTNAVIDKHGKSAREADLLLQAYRENEKKGIKGVTIEQKELIKGIVAEEKAAQKRLESQRASASASKKEQSDAAREAERLEKERTRIAEQQYQMREDIAYRYADRNKKIETDLANEIKQIQEANFSPKDTSGFTENAKRRAMLERELYQAQLAAELNDWQDTEEQKLDRKVFINELLIQLDADMNDEVKQQAMKSLLDRSNFEIQQIKLAKEQRLLSYKEALMTESDLVKARYQLEVKELDTIIDKEEKRIALQTAANKFIRGGLAPSGTPQPIDTIGKTSEQILQEETGRELLLMQERYMLAQQAAKDNNEQLLQIERDYLAAKEDLHAQHDIAVVEARQADFEGQMQLYSSLLSQTSAVWGSMTQMVKEAKGEQSSTYKAMFLAQQAIAIGQQIINTELAAMQPLAQMGIFGMPASTLIRAMGYASVGIIAAQTVAGFKTGGYTGGGGVNDVAGVVHGQEYVFDAAATRRIGVDNLEAIRSGAPVVGGGGINVSIVNNGTPQTYDVQQMDENTVRIIAVDAVSRAISQPNSDVSKALQNNLMTGRRR